MVETAKKTSISNSKVTPVSTKFSVSYIRVSTKEQTKENKSGIERQEQDYLNWLEKHSEYENLDGFIFRDLGVSGRGKNSKAGALSLFLKAAEKGQIPRGTCLVVESMSRLTREAPREALKLINKIFDYDLSIAFVQWGGNVFDGGDSPVWFQIMGAITAASMEWKDKSERKNGYEEKIAKQLKDGDFSSFKPRKKGTKGNLYPFWIYIDENTGKAKAYEKEKKLIQRIFNMSETMGITKIAKILKNEGIKSPLNGKNKYLSKDSISTCILKNRAVLGEKTKRGVVCYPFPPIITTEQFERVAAAKENRKLNRTFTGSTNKTVNLFQGVIRCGHCGGRMDVITRRRIVGTKKWAKGGEKVEVEMAFLQCHNAKAYGDLNCKATNTVPYKQIHNDIDNELEILNRIKLFRWEDYLTDEKHEEEVEIQKNKRLRALDEKNQIKAKLENLKKAESAYFAEGRAVPVILEIQQNEITEEYKKAETKYQREILDLQNLQRKKSGKAAAKDIQDKVNNFLDKDRFIEEKRSEFNLFLKEIGLAVEVLIPEKVSRARKYESKIKIEVGIGMYDFITNEYKGLDTSSEDLVSLGVDVEQVKESELKSYENYKIYKEQSLKAGRDLRFPKLKKEIKKITDEEFSKRIEAKL